VSEILTLVAKALAADIGVQETGIPLILGDDLREQWPVVDGPDFGRLARVAISTISAQLRRDLEASIEAEGWYQEPGHFNLLEDTIDALDCIAAGTPAEQESNG
jgi:hypothetical protein